ncbi:molybdopterin-dependent oxidoreductase [Desulfopila sp. IMCC35008]|uniref:molybdopterin-dependent oxidoreductase n=1 Tax=Desulfopila sp. IMCC35008 TaxID=2653858 RepID=UPI0013D20933|nr:molybdopterin-dependent oxidoreductase [Desulfopila sp. IMCC35008]
MKQNFPAEYKKTVCPLDCPDSCGILAKVVDNRVVSLKGDPDHGYTNGVICRKMRSYNERVYGKDRLLYPMVRTGAKGAGEFRRISMREAIALFAAKLKETKEQFGGEAILPFQYAGNMGVLNRNAGYGLYNKLGTSRIIETICSAAAGEGWSLHCSSIPGSPPEVAEVSSLIVAWGINVRVSNMHFWQYISKARKNGAQLVVIDPYRNETARSSDLHLKVLPGGDSGLALGVLKFLLEEEKIDRQMLVEQTTGFAELEAYLQKESWHQIYKVCGLEKEVIASFASLLKDNPATFIRIGIGLSRNSRGGMSVRAIVCLAAALGLFSGQTGQGVLLSSKAYTGDTDRLRFPELAEKETRLVNMAHLGHALTTLEPPVKLLSVYSSNPLTVAPDSGMVRNGLMREDLFTIVHEQVMTPTARYADLVIPATTFLENKDLYTGYGHFYLGCVDRVIEPVGEAVSNFDLYQLVARELGYIDAPFSQTVEQRLSEYVSTMEGLPENFEFDPDNPDGRWYQSSRQRVGQSAMEMFQVPFRFSAHVKQGISSIPCLSEGDEFDDKDLCSRFPLKLIIPPHADMLNSTFGERYSGNVGEVLIHPDDADKYTISDGEKVILQNFRGKTVRCAKVSSDTQPGLLVAEGLYWQSDDQSPGINVLTSQKTTDIGAGPTFHESRVAIRQLGEFQSFREVPE